MSAARCRCRTGRRSSTRSATSRSWARLGDRGDPQLPDAARRLDLWRHQRDHEEHRLQGGAGAVTRRLVASAMAGSRASRRVGPLDPAFAGMTIGGRQEHSMDFDLTEEQRLLRDSVDRLLADTYALRQAQGLSGRARRVRAAALWAQYAELGLLGLPFAEEHGGFGGGAGRDDAGHGGVRPGAGAGAVSRDGRARAAPRCASPAATRRNRRCCRAIAEGNLRLAFAHGERQARYDLTDVLTTAKPKGGGWVLDGAQERRRRTATAPTSWSSAPAPPATATTPTASRCSWSTPAPTASRAAPTRCATAPAPPRSR